MPSIILKKSSVAAKTPLVTDLSYGELALNYADGKLYYKTASNTISYFTTGTAQGTVTSVAGAGTVSGLTLTGTVTSSGSLTLGGTLAVTPSNFASQTANTVLAAPNGAAGTPTFRALVAADIPTLSYLPLSGGTLTGQIILPVSTNTAASLNLPHGVAPTTPVNGDVWTSTSALFVRINGATHAYGGLSQSNNWTNSQTVTASFSNPIGSATFNVGSTTQTTGTITMGGNRVDSTGAITIGQSQASQTLGLHIGAAASGATKTLNIGTGGLAGSTTTITIGSATGTSTTNVLGVLQNSGNQVLHAGNYSSYALPLSGGTLTGNLSTSGTVTATSGFIGRLYGAASGAPDNWIWSVSPANPTWGMYYNEGTPDAIEFRAADAVKASIFLDTGAATFASTVTAPTFSGALSGNATTATTLQTARNINGVSFNGSADITVADATKLPLSGGTVTGVLIGNGGFANVDGGIRIANPGGASYATTTSIVTGAIKIRLPAAALGSNTMMSFRVRVYQYNGGMTQEFVIAGYNYGDSASTWYNVSALSLSDTGSDFTIRFGKDGTSQCVYIGELNSSWSYPQVHVVDFCGGYSGMGASTWATGWNISFESSAFAGVTNSRTAWRSLNATNYSSFALPLSGGTMTGELTLGGTNVWFGSATNIRNNSAFSFLTNSGSAQNSRFGGIQVSDSYSGTIPSNGILFGTDTQLVRAATGHLDLGGNRVLHAGNYSSYAVPYSGSGTITVSSSAGGSKFIGVKAGSTYGDTTGVFTAILDNANGTASYLFDGYKGGSGGTRTFYVRADGAGYFADSISIAGNTALHAGNYSTYALPLTGGGAIIRNVPAISNNSYQAGNNHFELRTTDGSNPTIGFHRSGYTAVALYHSDNNKLRLRDANTGTDSLMVHSSNYYDAGIFGWRGSLATNGWNDATTGLWQSNGQTNETGGPGGYGWGGLLSFRANDFGSNHRLQIYASHTGDMAFRTGWSDWSYAWRTILHSANFNSYAPTLTGTGASGTWNININGSAGSAASATSATSANGLANLGYSSDRLSWYQGSGTFAGQSGWASYLISNHGAGATYYNQTLIMPFWGAPQYSRLEGGVFKGPYTILSTENYTSYSPSLTGSGASGTWNISVNGSAGSVAWSGVTGKPTTLSGYGITDAASTTSLANYLPLTGGALTGDFRIGATSNSGYWGSSSTTARARFDHSHTATTPNAAAPALALVNTDQTNTNLTSLVLGTLNGAGGNPLGMAAVYSINRANSNPAGPTGALGFAIANASSQMIEGARLSATGFNVVNAITQNGSQVLHAGNYSSYALPLSGGILTGKVTTQQTAGAMVLNDSSSSFEVRGPTNGSGDSNLAMVSFHLPNMYAIKMGLRGDGYFGIGGWSRAAWTWYTAPNGDMTSAGNVIAYSDERLKKDWISLPTNFVERLAKVKNGTYTRTDTQERQAGSSAQDWQQLLPEVVTVGADDDKTLGLAYGNAALVSAIELAKEVVSLRDKLSKLEDLVQTLINKG